jgi:hypothetical protein
MTGAPEEQASPSRQERPFLTHENGSKMAFVLPDFADELYGAVNVRGWTTMKLGFAAEPTEVSVPLESLATT